MTLFRDRTVSRFRIVNGINKYVTKTSETISLDSVEHRVTRKPVAKAKPQPKPTVTLSPISIPVRERNWMNLNPNSSKHFLYFRAIHGHSGGNFTEYIYLVGNVSEIHSKIISGIEPRRKKSQMGQAVRVFHCSEPDGRRSKHGRNFEATWTSQGSHHTKILGDFIKMQFIGAI